MTDRIGWLGTGRMGAAMVHRLLDAGQEVTVWNRTAAKTAPLAERGAKVAAAKTGLGALDIVFTMVGTPADLEDGLLSGRPCPPSSSTARRSPARCPPGCARLSQPGGSPSSAPRLAAIPTWWRRAAVGTDREAFLRFLGGTVVASDWVRPALVERDYTPAASLAVMKKDLDLALAACGESARELPLTDLVRGLYSACAERGWAERDFACLDEPYHAPGPAPGARTLTEDQCR